MNTADERSLIIGQQWSKLSKNLTAYVKVADVEAALFRTTAHGMCRDHSAEHAIQAVRETWKRWIYEWVKGFTETRRLPDGTCETFHLFYGYPDGKQGRRWVQRDYITLQQLGAIIKWRRRIEHGWDQETSALERVYDFMLSAGAGQFGEVLN